MIKVLVAIRKKRDITMEAFIRYYEDHHVPLVNRLLPFYAGYRRSYLVEAIWPAGMANDHDVITELRFADEPTYAAWGAALQDAATIAQIRADEAHFLDSDATRMWRVHDEGGAGGSES